MLKRKLGKSDLEVSVLTLGCMSLGTDKEKAKNIIDFALDTGINHLDTADLYDFGLNEEIVGEAIKGKRDQIVLTTKVGNHFNKESKAWFWDPSKPYIKSEVKESLRRLQTDYIDFYMLHGGTLDDPIDETIEAFEELKQEGVIRAYGISSIRPNVIREYVKRSSIDGVMTQYSLLDRRPEEEILDLLHKNNISVLVRGPLAKGMLSNRAKEQIINKGKNGFLDYSFEDLIATNEKLSSITNNMNELALQYVLTHPAVATAVFGASSIEQVKENTAIAMDKTLSEEVYHLLKSSTKENRYEDHR
ncbi:aldo/keto reductase [Ornithinibacillus halotolerans]|uniref:Oxidoreductase YqkF n=1 Tax=Ornithinibacillus halotolerans TaxID=1274357 RepID=A0A916RLI1_9BACI|nr:aldo/keto reductase [Ornithinibacillus halotolerans]GGA60736.1 putative oxidoreductase YqkF [Ornithinibacillus halotolerans]